MDRNLFYYAISLHGLPSFFSFLNQQFITWSTRADRGSYFVTMYRKNENIWRLEKENENKYKEEEKLYRY